MRLLLRALVGGLLVAPVLFVATPASAASGSVATAARLWTGTATVHPGQTARISGAVTYGASRKITGKYVSLQVQSGSTWRFVERKRLAANGWAIFTVPTASRTYRLYYPGMASAPGVTAFKASVSPPKAIRLTPWPTSVVGARIVAAAAREAGKPYVFGAAGPSAFDCSGLTRYVFRQFGLSLPHDANAQQRYGRAVSAASALPGDLVFFRDGSGYAYHVGIYVGGGYMIDAPQPGSTVGRHKVWSSSVVYRRLL